MSKNNIPWLKRIYTSIQELIEINKQHVEITRDISENSMSLKEQRFFNWVQIILIILGFVGVGFLVSLFIPHNEISVDYDINVKVIPDRILMNDASDKTFKFTFLNSGKKNITDFDVYEIKLYRLEDGNFRYYRQLLGPADRKYMSCQNYASNNRLDVGKECTFTLEKPMFGCKECFDDKDKQVMLFFYFKSVPPIENGVVNLTVY